MIGRYIPEWLRHVPAPGARGFATLAGLEASVRATLVSVWPLAMYQALGNARLVSLAYFLVGLASLAYGLLIPWLNRHVPRRWLYTAGTVLYVLGPSLAMTGRPALIAAGLLFTGWGTVTVFICANAYLMDYIERHDLGRSETLKLFYSAASWAIGPVAGVWLWKMWAPLPFLIAIGFAVTLAAVFWAMRLGDGKLIARARGPAPNPLAYLGRFVAQPRLIAGFSFAVLRSSGWWVFVVYLPIWCVQSGLGDRIASFAFSAANALLFLSPLMLRFMQRIGLRRAVQTSFALASVFYALAAMAPVWPPLAVVAMFCGSVFLVMLDTFGSLPFLMAVRPAERTEMAAVYSSFRDVSGILTPGVAWLVLLVAPVPGVFAACAAGLATAAGIATRLHPRLGSRRA